MYSSQIVKNPIDFNLIEIRKYKIDRLNQDINRGVYGLDTETLNGYCKLLCDNKSNIQLSKKLENVYPSDIDLFLRFLTSHRFRNNHNFFYNLNYDINAIIKYLPKENLEELYLHTKTTYKDYELLFIPKKLFRINKDKQSYKYYDIAQFYGKSLEYNARKYLNKEKYLEEIDGAILGTSLEYWEKNLNKIIRYCINDCKLTYELGKLLNDTLIKNIKLIPNSYISKAGITKDFVRKQVKLFDITKIPRNALKYAFYSYSGGRFEVTQKGNIGTSTLYDIKSAYPYTIRNLLDLDNGIWKRTNSLHEKADYGFYLVKVYVKYNYISPLGITLKNGINIYPIMALPLYLTKDELLSYEKYIEFEIIDGWEYFTDNKIYPFREYIDKIYSLKNDVDKDNYEYNIYKILMNSLYGCFYEKFISKDKTDLTIKSGKLFNPVYATIITAKTRINLFLTAQLNPKKVVGFATDSILFKGNVDIPTENKLGKWDLEIKGKSIVLRGGIYKIGDNLKSRGIKKISGIKTPYGKYENIFDYIIKKPELPEYPVIINRPLSFIEVLLHHKKHDLTEINQFVDMKYTLDLNKDFKRLWDDKFNNGGELFSKSINSNPLILY